MSQTKARKPRAIRPDDLWRVLPCWSCGSGYVAEYEHQDLCPACFPPR